MEVTGRCLVNKVKTIIICAAFMFLPLAGIAQCPAFSPVDVFLNFNGASPGTTATTANLQASTEGTGTWSTATSAEKYAASRVALPASIAVNGGTSHGCGYATQSLAMDESSNFSTSEFDFNNGKSQVVVQGLIVNTPPSNPGSGNLFDYVITVGTGAPDAGGVVQIQAGNSASCGGLGTPTPATELESYSGSGGTFHSPCITIASGGTIFFSHYMNFGTTGNCNVPGSNINAPCEGLHVYTVSGTTFTEIGTGVNVALDASTSTLSYDLIGNNEGDTFSGSSYFQWLMWDWTNHKWPNLPTGGTQLWSGILSPVGSCNFGTGSVANPCGIQWQGNVGVPGGATALSNSALKSGSTIAAGSSQTTINAALASCGGTSTQQKYVLLNSGTFPLTGTIKVPSYCELRGTLTSGGTASVLQLGAGSYDTCEPYTSGDTCGVALGEDPGLSNTQIAITAGATAGSTSLTLASVSGMAVGGYLVITETNAAWVSANGDEGTCTWCDGGLTANGTRSRAQIVEITGISGSVVTIKAPGLFTAFTNTPTAVYFAASAKYSGLRDVQLYA